MTDQRDPEPGERLDLEQIEASPFIAWLLDHHDGETLAELDEALADVLHGVQTYGKKGSIGLAVSIDQQGRTVAVKTEVKTKIPREPITPDVFYADRQGGLHRKDPDQPVLPFNVVSFTGDDGEVRQVEPGSGEVKQVGEPS